MTVFYRIASHRLAEPTNFNVAIQYCMVLNGVSVNQDVTLVIATPTTATAMRINETIRAALSTYINSTYGASTAISDMVPFSARGNLVRVPIDFGFIPDFQETSVTATQSAAWVTANSVITCQVQNDSSGDHEPEDAALDGLNARAINLVPGVSFDVICYAPEGAWGRYQVNCVGN